MTELYIFDGGMSFESIVSSMQKGVYEVLCVRNGVELLIYADNDAFPQNLRLIGMKTNDVLESVEYHFMSGSCAYTFFRKPLYSTEVESDSSGSILSTERSMVSFPFEEVHKSSCKYPSIHFDSGFYFGHILGQIQNYSRYILCIKDQRIIKVYRNSKHLPTSLVYKSSYKHQQPDVEEYHFTRGKHNYVFFSDMIVNQIIVKNNTTPIVHHYKRCDTTLQEDDDPLPGKVIKFDRSRRREPCETVQI